MRDHGWGWVGPAVFVASSSLAGCAPQMKMHPLSPHDPRGVTPRDRVVTSGGIRLRQGTP